MKKFFILSIALILAGIYTTAQTKTTDPGVVINGVKWATRNVDAPGTFADKPESAGMFYQWNRKKAWNTTDKEVTDWDDSTLVGTSWEKANDPCPKGWRVPTIDEIKKLLDKDKVTSEWTTRNGINGRLFTDKSTGNALFLPAVGNRYGLDGTLYGVGTYGSCRSSTQYSETYAYYFHFNSGSAVRYSGNRRYGLSVRAVAE